MIAAQKIQISMSEVRERINALLNKDDRTDEETNELREKTTRMQGLEVEYRAAISAEPDPPQVTITQTEHVDPEVRERLELRGRASFGAYLVAALEGRLPAGAEAEYSAAFKVPAGRVPLDLFERDRPAAREVREDAATTVPASGLGATLAPIQPYVFAGSIAPRLGIAMPMVGTGAYSEATITTALTAGAKAKGSAQESTAAALTTVTANPRRVAARLTLQIEDIAAIGQANFESAVRSNASARLSDEYDRQCINGDGTAPNVRGLVKQLTDPDNPTAVATFDAFVASFSDQIDALWASRLKEVAIVTNAEVYKLACKTFRDRVIDTGQRGGVSLGDVSFADYAEAKTG